MIQRLVNLGWLETINTSAMTNYPANLETIYQSRDWDPGNLLAAPYVSGMTGLGFDQAVTGEQTNLDILFSDDYAGRLTYLDDLRDTVGLSALRLGFDPTTITSEQWDASLAEVKAAIDARIVRAIPGQSYIETMASRDVVLAVAWSGDVLTLLVPYQSGDQDFQWRLAEQGGMLWSDNMAIPLGAANKAQAETFINWYYEPANAASIVAYVNYVTPVKGASEFIVGIDPALADNPLIFPTEEMRARLYQFRSLDEETATAWEEAFADVMGL
jgi:spermidine/putrescine transport system substrate-binding protein